MIEKLKGTTLTNNDLINLGWDSSYCKVFSIFVHFLIIVKRNKMEKIYLRTNWLEYYNLSSALGYFAENTNTCFLPYHNITHACEVLYHALSIAARENYKSIETMKCLGIAAIFHNANYIPYNNHIECISCCNSYFDFIKEEENRLFTIEILESYYSGIHDVPAIIKLSNFLQDANVIYLLDSQFLPQQIIGRYEEEKGEGVLSLQEYIDDVISNYEKYIVKNLNTGYAYDMWKEYKDSFKDRLLKLKKNLK